jgi:transcriptional regulator with XRE-family HTH domain
MAILNERIKERRTSLDLTLVQVAEYLGVKEATVQRYESGDIKNIKHETIAELAKIFNCTPAYLMGWEEPEIKTIAAHHDETEWSTEEINEIEKFKEFVKSKRNQK